MKVVLFTPQCHDSKFLCTSDVCTMCAQCLQAVEVDEFAQARIEFVIDVNESIPTESAITASISSWGVEQTCSLVGRGRKSWFEV